MPTWATRMQCFPIFAPWPIMTWSSIFVPSPTMVSPTEARSMVQPAPISTSSPMRTAPIVSLDLIGDEDGASSRARELRGVARIGEEAELIVVRVGERGYAGNETVGGACVAPADQFDDFLNCDRGHEPRHCTLRFAKE